MALTKQQVGKTIAYWNIGKIKQIKKLPSGFHSDNWLITSGKGKFVIKCFFPL